MSMDSSPKRTVNRGASGKSFMVSWYILPSTTAGEQEDQKIRKERGEDRRFLVFEIGGKWGATKSFSSLLIF
jgi:hypothetical protein